VRFVGVCDSSLKPTFDFGPGRFIGLVIVARSYAPDPKLPIAAIQVSSTMNGEARVRSLQQKTGCQKQ
jgi:hypothetical protein